MTKKLECIRNLKSKLNQMQRDLNRIESSNHSLAAEFRHEKALFNKTTTLADFHSVPTENSLTKCPSWRNPTFWGSNPITGKQNNVQSPKVFTKTKSPRHVPRELSPEISQLKLFASEKYYEHSEEQPRARNQQNNNQNCMSQKYLSNYQGVSKETPRFQKIKTYDHPITDPIINPEKHELKGKKIVVKAPLSPLTNLVQNPKSNPSIYFFNDKIVHLSPKHSNKKNVSPSVRELLSSSLQEKVTSPKRKSCKKHFLRYFKETYESKWD